MATSRALTHVAVAFLLVATATCAGKTPTEPDAPAPAPSSSSGVAPSITAQPQNQAVEFGQPASLAVSASGTAPLDYTWFFGSPGNTTAPVSVPNASSISTPGLTASTNLWVRVSNAYGSANSAVAAITVLPEPSGPVIDPSLVSFEDEVLAWVNQQRAGGAVCGGVAFPSVAPLSMHGQLRAAARAHSADMATLGYFAHTSLDGRTYTQRIQDAGYFGPPTAENIGAGYATPQAVATGWMASAGHCANIMSGSYRSIGVGYAFRAGSPFGHYWTADFGGS